MEANISGLFLMGMTYFNNLVKEQYKHAKFMISFAKWNGIMDHQVCYSLVLCWSHFWAFYAHF